MYQLFKSLSLRQALTDQAPVLLVSFIIAELFFKFHSFTLECGAFLVTWYALDAGLNFLKKRLAARQ